MQMGRQQTRLHCVRLGSRLARVRPPSIHSSPLDLRETEGYYGMAGAEKPASGISLVATSRSLRLFRWLARLDFKGNPGDGFPMFWLSFNVKPELLHPSPDDMDPTKINPLPQACMLAEIDLHAYRILVRSVVPRLDGIQPDIATLRHCQVATRPQRDQLTAEGNSPWFSDGFQHSDLFEYFEQTQAVCIAVDRGATTQN